MPRSPLASVMTIVHNEPLVADVCEQVRTQRYRPLELVLWDDGSTDGTASVIERFVGRTNGDLPIRRGRFEVNQGRGAARQAALGISTGRWIIPIDADDRVDPSYVSAIMSVAGRVRSSVAMIAPTLRMFGGPERFAEWVKHPEVPQGPEDFAESPAVVGIAAFRADAARAVGGYTPHANFSGGAEDWGLQCALYAAGYGFACAPKAVYWYRYTEKTIEKERRNAANGNHRATFHRLYPSMFRDATPRWVSKYWVLPRYSADGRAYRRGQPIPYAEALRQGQAR